ncbi:unnamed protein product [Arabidopsis halleri]
MLLMLDCVFRGTRDVNDRVKTVLECERKKLQLSDTRHLKELFNEHRAIRKILISSGMCF